MGGLSSVHKYLMKGNEYEGATFFSLMPRDRRQDNVNKVKYRESHLNIRKLGVAERGCGVSICGDIQNFIGHRLEQPSVGQLVQESDWTRQPLWIPTNLKHSSDSVRSHKQFK